MLQWRDQFKQGEKKLFLVNIHTYTTQVRPFKTHLDVAMERACRQGEKKVIQVKHTHTQHKTIQ